MSGSTLIAVAIIFALLIAGTMVMKGRKKAASVDVNINLAPSMPGASIFRDTGPSVVDISPVKLDSKTARRRTAGITCYVGRNGQGKTLCAVHDVVPDLKAGRPVLSTVALTLPDLAETVEEADAAWADLVERTEAAAAEGEWSADAVHGIRPADPLRLPHPGFVPLIAWKQLLDLSYGVVLLDEIQGIADSRDSSGLPAEIRNKFFQMRREDVRVVWTTISWTSADKRMREATNILTFCKGTLPKRIPGKIWATNRMFYYRSYDPADFQDFNDANARASKTMRPRPLFRQWMHIERGLKEASKYYDSGANVLSLGTSGEGGKCLSCGKGRKREYCSCADHLPRRKRAARPLDAERGSGGQDASGEGVDSTGTNAIDEPAAPDTCPVGDH